MMPLAALMDGARAAALLAGGGAPHCDAHGAAAQTGGAHQHHDGSGPRHPGLLSPGECCHALPVVAVLAPPPRPLERPSRLLPRSESDRGGNAGPRYGIERPPRAAA
jgi:hypothetical protein